MNPSLETESARQPACASTALALVIGMSCGLLAAPAMADDFIIIQSTTSTQNSGLYEALLPQAQAATGVEPRVVAVGTGQAITNATNCDADVLLVHARASEEAFVAAGYGLSRADLMYNDFVVIGPASDPAGVAGSSDVTAALAAIADAGAPFASRGDDSGTHKAELALWAQAGVDPSAASGSWYRETGSGMGATLNVATEMGAYALTDRATWISYANKGDAQVAVEGDERLFNQYGIIAVNPAHCPEARVDLANRFIDWLVSDEGQNAIAAFRIDGQQLFFPNAKLN